MERGVARDEFRAAVAERRPEHVAPENPRPVLCGTELNITQEGIPSMIPAEMCTLGWQESLTFLAQLVEPEILDQP